MIDQMTLQTIGILLTAVTVSIAAIYYTLTLRYTRRNQDLQLETRQAQLFIQLYRDQKEPRFLQAMGTLISQGEVTDVDVSLQDQEYRAAYFMVSNHFEGIGVLVHKGLIDVELVDDIISGGFTRFWEYTKPVTDAVRESRNWPQWNEFTEYLYNRVKSLVLEQHPELKT